MSALRRTAITLGPASRRLAERLAYRPREVVVVALLAGGLSAGLAVEQWRTRHPDVAARLEAEPPRPAAAFVPVSARPRPRRALPRCEMPAGGAALDLNRATPRELAQLAGISWGLAARILAARDAAGRPGRGVAPAPWIREPAGRPDAAGEAEPAALVSGEDGEPRGEPADPPPE